MVELILQDYINAWSKLDRETFCHHVQVPLLVANKIEDELVFQSEATQFVDVRRPEPGEVLKRFNLNPQQPVLELRQTRSGGKQQITVGRAEENDLVVVDETVSALHAVFVIDPTKKTLRLQDQDSTNGTQINGTLLVSGHFSSVRDGDIVSFGDSQYIFFTPGGLYDELNRWLKMPNEKTQEVPHLQKRK